MSALHQFFTLLVAVAIPVAAFVAGLRTTRPLWLWEHRGLLVRSLLSILLVVPLLSLLLVEWLAPGDVRLRAGIELAILCIGISAPDMLKGSRSRDESSHFRLSLNLVLLCLSIVYIPAALAIHGAAFGHDVVFPPLGVARVVLGQALLPFLAGLAFTRLWPKISPAVERHAERFVNLVLLVVVAFALIALFPALLRVGARGWLLCAAIAMVAIAVGHLMGGPTATTRSGLAVSSAIRFPALALLIATSVPGVSVVIPVVLVYVVTSGILTGVYMAAVARRHAVARAEAKS